jgi:energy-coupling factor transporter ATP-binding protein EcfA2
MWDGGGCDNRTILESIGLTLRDMYPIRADDRRLDPVVATYRYVDEQGELLYEVQRTVSKRFYQRRPDPDKPGGWLFNLENTRRVLYRLPAIMQAIREGQTVYVVEGEKDVHSLEHRGCVATTSPGGAGKWRPEYTEALRGADVIVVTDLDKATQSHPNGHGQDHSQQVCRQLLPIANSVTLVAPAAGKDTTDHLTAGLELDAMVMLGIEAAATPNGAGGSHTGPVVDPPEEAPVSPAGSPLDDRRNRIRLTPASAFKIRAVQWVWDQRMPLGELCLIAGREGVGKSTFLAWLAAAVTNGNLPGIYHGEPRALLYAANEDAWSYTIAPRMAAAGANLEMIYRIDVMEDDGPAGLSLPRDCRYLPEIATEVNAAMLMCDPILSLIDERINTNRGQELRRALEPLKTAAEQAGLAVPALVHFNKTTDVDVLSMLSGSRAWAEVARAVIAIAQDRTADEYSCVVSQAKNNLGRSDLPSLIYTIDDVALETEEGPDAHVGRIRWTGESDDDAESILRRRTPSTERPENVGDSTNHILDWIEEQGHGVTTRQVGDAFPQLQYGNVKAILSRCASRGLLYKPGHGLYAAPLVSSTLGEA